MSHRNYFLYVATWALIGMAWMPIARAQDIFPRIINGTPTDAFPSVGIVGDTVYGGFGSGTLISPFHVLTAAHVADVFRNRPTTGIFQIGDEQYPVRRVFIHPKYNSQQLSSDIAVLELADALVGIVPSELFTGTPHVGDLLQIVGYGGGGDASGGDGSFGVKRVAVTTIDAVSDTQIIWTFHLEDEGNTAAGDSGGPGFLGVGGQLQIASITSGGTTVNSELGDVSFNTRVDAFADWVQTILDSGIDDGSGSNPPDDQPPVDDNPPAQPPPVQSDPCHVPPHHPAPGHYPGPMRQPGPAYRPGPTRRPGPAHRPGAWHGPSAGRRPGTVPPAPTAPAINNDSAPARFPGSSMQNAFANMIRQMLEQILTVQMNRQPQPTGPLMLSVPPAQVSRSALRAVSSRQNIAATSPAQDSPRRSAFSIWNTRR